MKLTKEQCNEIISWISYFGKANVRNCPDVCSPAGLHKSRLDYNICEVKRGETTQWFFDLISEFLKNDYPNNKIKKGNYFYAHEFFTGAKFTKHIDKERQNDWALVIGAKLNNDFNGGKLLTYNPDSELATEMGVIYKMNSNTLHEVTEVTEGTRYSFVYFITHDELGIENKIL
jgi:flagellar basal body rod protein FlgC